MPKPHLNQVFDIHIDDLGVSGEGVGHVDGFTIFVDGALPGETVQAKLIHSKRSFGRAELLRVHQASPERVRPPCPLFDRCGGCQLMHLDYKNQLEFKQSRIAKAMRYIGKINDVLIEPCLPSPTQLAYRNKIQLLVAPVRTGEEINCPSGQFISSPVLNGELAIGLYARGSHDIVPIHTCAIHCPQGESIFQEIRAIIQQSKITPYDAATGKGDLRHILIKSAIQTKQSLVVLVTNGPASPALRQVAKAIMARSPSVKGVVQNINIAKNNVILGDTYELLSGVPTIEEELSGLRFKVSAASFFQVNPAQAVHLYQKALEFAELSSSDVALDAYCGVGTLTLFIARQAKEVIGIENVPEAIDDAKENAERNGIHNAEFVCTTTEEYLKGFHKKVDLIFLNPPRKGCEVSVLKSIAQIKPKKIIYISCDPATLARDLGLLGTMGFQVDCMQPYDMFPQTAHVECVAKLSRI